MKLLETLGALHFGTNCILREKNTQTETLSLVNPNPACMEQPNRSRETYIKHCCSR